jgi:hypothetical protein
MNEREVPSPPLDDPEARLYSTVPLEDEDGNEYVIQQQNVGRENMEGEGEWPDPDTPPRAPAPGSADVDDPAQSKEPATPTPTSVCTAPPHDKPPSVIRATRRSRKELLRPRSAPDRR